MKSKNNTARHPLPERDFPHFWKFISDPGKRLLIQTTLLMDYVMVIRDLRMRFGVGNVRCYLNTAGYKVPSKRDPKPNDLGPEVEQSKSTVPTPDACARHVVALTTRVEQLEKALAGLIVSLYPGNCEEGITQLVGEMFQKHSSAEGSDAGGNAFHLTKSLAGAVASSAAAQG